MEIKENLAAMIDLVHPGDSSLLQLDELLLHSKYISLSEPNPQQIRLFYRKLSGAHSKASLCICHGFSEHSARYMGIAARLALRGYDVHLIDLRSFGVSGGARGGHDLYDYQADVGTLLREVRPDLPCFVWGHSMGGLVVTTLLLNNPTLNIAGAVITGSLYGHRLFKHAGQNSVLRSIAPELKQLTVNTYLCPGATSRDDAYLKQIFEDTKLCPMTSLPLLASFSLALEQLGARAKDFKFPAIWFHGDSDSLTDPSETVKFYIKATSLDKTLRIYYGGYHELHHDIERDRFYEELIDWLDQRVETPPIGSIGLLKIGPLLPPKPRRWSLFLALGVMAYISGAVNYRPRGLAQLFGIVVLQMLPKLLWPLTMISEKLIPFFK